MGRIDMAILRFVQKWIADPLQFSGISLAFQRRTSLALACASWFGLFLIHGYHHEWWMVAFTGSVVLLTTHMAIHGEGGGWTWQLWLFMLALDIPMLAADFNVKTFLETLLDVSILLNVYLCRCKPKPPTGSLKFAVDPI